MRMSRTIIGVLTGATVWGLALSPAFAATATVTVQPGESMWTIAEQNGISLNALESANSTINPNSLEAGTQLQIPTSFQAYDTPGNLYWLAQVINAEAGGETLETQIAVGDVIMHRVISGSYGGNSVYDVVFQQSNGVYQFSSVENGYIYSTPDSSSVQAAQDVLQNGTDVVPGALVFYNPAQTSAGNWVTSQPTVTQIGHLVFAQ